MSLKNPQWNLYKVDTIVLIFSQSQEVVNIILINKHNPHYGDLVWAGESDRMPFIDRTEYITIFYYGLSNISYCHYNQ